MAPPPRRPPELMEEIVEEVLLRFPPEDPASLVRAALVSKRWCLLVAGRGFRRRFRQRHRAPPMLGFVCNVLRDVYDDEIPDNARFVPTSPSGLPQADRHGWRALDARHGRVLLHRCPGRGRGYLARWGGNSMGPFVVWDPVTGELLELPTLPPERCYPWPISFNATVLCAAAACDHLDCRRQQFNVVFVGIYGDGMLAYVYSSETGVWSEPTIAQHPRDYYVHKVPAAVVGNAVYFVFRFSTIILKYDLGMREMSVIDLPSTSYCFGRIIPMTTDEGRLGFTTVERGKLHLWTMEVGPQDDVVWKQDWVTELEDLLPPDALWSKPAVAGYVNGQGVILLATVDGYYTVDPKTNQAAKVGGDIDCGRDFYIAVPYMSFYFPALGTDFTDEGLEAGDPSALGSSNLIQYVLLSPE